MTLEERSNLVLAFARVLYVNGQATDQTMAAAQQLGDTLGLSVKLLPRWGELQIQFEDGDSRVISAVAADPAGVNMDRVASTMQAIEDLRVDRLAPAAAMEAITKISKTPPAPVWLFTFAAAAGAVALAVIFGVQHLAASVLIFVSAGAGALLRRCLAQWSENMFLQPFCASLLAGFIGALAVRYQLSSSLRLVAVCPCMVLVPGPHVLNGALDLVKGRIHLGAARLIYAGLVVVAISTGLLLGLALLHVSFPVDPSGRVVSVARHDCRWRRCFCVQRLFLHATSHAALASGSRYAGSCFEVGRAHQVWLQRSGRSLGCLSDRRIDPHSCRAASAHAVCGYRLRFCRVDDSGCLPIQDGQWHCATCRRLACDVGPHKRGNHRRHDRCHDHFSDELRPHCSEIGHRSLLQ